MGSHCDEGGSDDGGGDAMVNVHVQNQRRCVGSFMSQRAAMLRVGVQHLLPKGTDSALIKDSKNLMEKKLNTHTGAPGKK